ncbi:uncharacterized protein BDZ99DRAFT_466587 [Mytilinidion resinicola]|uniref:RNase III domain-containing protein n=1 Tax=Mytilinidion resinicola TaxID=574789 RepID=A0A6A6YC86_9PEZI|nr:uncharacterized protein BDZ99DRAFT_466587 [Mytilinidion resinicola]KAF2805634.1 hypothetical protein BDZ99DRAFT_466587 [Mytilinidion resinicola]
MPTSSFCPQDDKMEGCQKAVDSRFRNSKFLWEALQAARLPVFTNGGRMHPDGNKRLAVLGDVVLKLVLGGTSRLV